MNITKNFEIRSENDIRLPPHTLKVLRQALEAADRRGCDPSILNVRIDDMAISVWEDKSAISRQAENSTEAT